MRVRDRIRGRNITLLALAIFPSALVACSSAKTGEPKSIISKPATEEEHQLAIAMDTYDRGLFSVSEDGWTELRDGFPASYFAPLAELKIADARYFRGDYPGALQAYEDFARLHPGHEAIPYVRYQLANCSLEQYRGKSHDQAPLRSAMKAFEQLITQFPESEYVVFAKRNLDRARDLLAQHEMFVADFYEKRGNSVAAEKRRQMLRTLYPESTLARDAVARGDKSPLAEIPEKLKPELTPEPPVFVFSSPAAPAPTKRATSKDSPPSSPTILAATGTSPVADQGKAKLATTAPSIPGVSNPILDLECEESESKKIFVVTANAPLTAHRIESRTDSGTGLKLVFGVVPPSAATMESTQNDSLSACSAGSTNLRIESTSRTAGGESIVDAILAGGAEQNITVMTLERPYRAVIVIRTASK